MTAYAMPDPPPADVTTLWDAGWDEWCRLDDLAHWVPRDTLDDEPHITEAAIDWQSLVYEYGPLSDTAPKETP